MSLAVDPFVHCAAQGLVAIVLARALVEKAGDYGVYAATLRDYRVAPDALAPAAAASLLAAETATFVLLLVPAARSVGALAAAGLFALYALAMTLALRAGRTEI